MKSGRLHGEVKSHRLSDRAGGTNPENSGKLTETEKLVQIVRGDCRSRCCLLRQLDESDAKGETRTCDLSAADLYELI